jgi:hypothetical protein
LAPPTAAPTGTPADPAALLRAAIEALASANQSLDHVAIAQGRLRVDNEALGKSTIYEDLALAYDRLSSSATVAVSARGPSGRLSASAKASFGAERRLTLEGADLALDDLMATAAKPPPFFSDMPISWRVEAALDDQNQIGGLQGRFSLGAGYFRLDDSDFQPMLVDEVTGRIHWDAGKRRFAVDSLEALAGGSHLKFSGSVAPPAAASPFWAVALGSDDSVLAPERPGGAAAVLDRVDFVARSFPDRRGHFQYPWPQGRGRPHRRRHPARRGRRAEDELEREAQRARRGVSSLAGLHQSGRAQLVPAAHPCRRSRFRDHEAELDSGRHPGRA